MELRVTHETRYTYAPAVETARHMVCLQPRDTARQTVLSHSLAVLPAPAQRNETRDVYGNQRAFFSLQAPHETLSVTAVSRVRTRPSAPAASRLAWEVVRERLRYRVGSTYDPASEFIFPSPHVPRHEAFASYARTSFTPGRPLREAAQELMARIHRDFSYETESTEVHTPALEALAQRRGVCQDFAHIMIAGLRAMGLAARYVSGYLLTQPPPGQPRLVGSDASHAWVSVYLPDLPGADQGQGWWDLDPTNHRDGWGSPGEDYVTLATGRDYSDISPMRGVIHGGARHTLSVGVTVEPAGEAAATPTPPIPKENP